MTNNIKGEMVMLHFGDIFCLSGNSDLSVISFEFLKCTRFIKKVRIVKWEGLSSVGR